MKLTEKLYNQTVHLWDAAADKPFVREMAVGTLPWEYFRNYMLQDYLYLRDYIDILHAARDCAEDAVLSAFLSRVIHDTEDETNMVHLPNLKKLGVGEDEIKNRKKLVVIVEYIGYMRDQLEENGIRAVLTALLQCSWVYAYIGQTCARLYGSRLDASPYASWFKAYTGADYIKGNNAWIRTLDDLCSDITEGEALHLCGIFITCAKYENRLWDSLYE